MDVGRDITDTSTIGWLDHWPTTPRYVQAFWWCQRMIRRRRPRAIIVIDAPGIGFPVARMGRSLGIPVVYYVTPQTWLWDPEGSVARLRRLTDVVVPAFPFEAELYRRGGLDVVFEGHPIRDDATSVAAAAHQPNAPDRVTLGLAPGSRRHAIRRLLPPMLDAAGQLRGSGAVTTILVSLASEALRPDVERLVGERPALGATIVEDFAQLLQESTALIAASGTNLLDTVLADVPVVACYRIDAVSYWIAEYVMDLRSRIPAFTVPNLLARQAVVPELIQSEVTGTRIAWQALRLLTDEHARRAELSGYQLVRAALGEPGVVERIAAALVRRLPLRQ
ncbi:MAG: hypothetical protein AB1806_02610 [Acidobacteriota bacterium]